MAEHSLSELGIQEGDLLEGHLKVGPLIGWGEQGVVVRVHHLEWDQQLALKLPLPKVLDSKVRKDRYLREANTWIRLGVHPNIVRCWFVKNVKGLPGLFLDLMETGTLQAWLDLHRSQPPEWEETVTMLLGAAEGLAHAHSHGLVHRDVKPGNFFLSKGRVQVSDFGLIKSTGEAEPKPSGGFVAKSNLGVTATGEFVGTPWYGAPEQWAGEEVSPAADIYALGILFFEMLTGRRPFDQAEGEIDAEALMEWHLHGIPADPREVRSEIPGSLAELCLQCLHKESEKRPGSMVDLIERLASAASALWGREYERPLPLPGGERPDLLNNTAVSLHSLEQSDEARELLARGLRIEAGHPQCLYNLIQLEHRAGAVDPEESLSRLRRSNLWHPVALLCLQEGRPDEAIEAIEKIPEGSRTGLAHRVQGDAYMYTRAFSEAEQAYQQAEKLLPGGVTAGRRQMARNESCLKNGRILFPSPNSVAEGQADLDAHLRISPDSQLLIEIRKDEIRCRSIETSSEPISAQRPEGSQSPEQTWLREDRLLIQDSESFELWRISDLELLTRSSGRVVTASSDLKRLLIKKDSGLWLFDKHRDARFQLEFSEGEEPESHVQARFSPSDGTVFVMTASGQLGRLEEATVQTKSHPRPRDILEDVALFVLDLEDQVVLVRYDGMLELLHSRTRAAKFSYQLSQVPHRLGVDSSGNVIIASSPTHSTLLSKEGELLLDTPGALGLDREKRHCLVVQDGFLTLFQLHPFRRCRAWQESILQPWGIHMAGDGRRAVTLSAEGVYHVWEVDEAHRVADRRLLLARSQGYSELVADYQRYSKVYSEAVELAGRQTYHTAYQRLKQAREVNGFHQAEEALALQWRLLPELRRSQLEAIWERLSTDDVKSSSLSGDSKFIAQAQEGRFTIWKNAGSQTSLHRKTKTSREFLGVHFVDSLEKGMLVVFMDRKGSGEFLKVSDGSIVRFLEFGCGNLRLVTFKDASIFFVNEHNLVGHYDLAKGEITSATASIDPFVYRVFPLREDLAIGLTPEGPLLMDLKSENPARPLPIKLASDLTAAEGLSERKSLLLGLADGTVMVVDEKSGRRIFGADLKSGAVTGFKIAPGLSIGAAATSQGKLALWDLQSGELLERFSAHSGPVVDLQMSSDGRYLTTIDEAGQFRLWETSWHLVDAQGPPPVDWLNRTTLDKLNALFKMRI